MSCEYKICPNTIISDSVTVVTDTLVIDIPDANYFNGCKYGLVIAQAIPDEATYNMPVAVSIGGDTTTVYPLVTCCGTQVVARQIATRYRYPVQVVTSATSGVFRVLGGLMFYCSNTNLPSLPAPTADALSIAKPVTTATEVVTPSKVTKTTTTTKKEVVSHEQIFKRKNFKKNA